MATFFRVQPTIRPVESILGDHHVSRPWVGTLTMTCRACGGSGEIQVGWDETATCAECGGRGEREDVRRGVSVCRSIADLAEYLANRAPNLNGDHVVEIEGDLSEDRDHDHGAPGRPLLVHPTRVVAVHPISVLW